MLKEKNKKYWYGLLAEFYTVIYVIEKIYKIELTNVWLECDSVLICVVFIARTNVPWILCNRCNTCLNLYGTIRFKVTHISLEVNTCTNKCANL